MEQIWLAFLPLFVAFDAVGVLPMYWALAQGLSSAKRRAAVNNAVLIAWLVALAFLLVSNPVFVILGIQMADVMIAGGAVLFVLALNELLRSEKPRDVSKEAIGVVPLGVPLIVGPAVLTTVLLLRVRYGLWVTVAALTLNVVLAWVMLRLADAWMERFGREGAKVISKVFGLILAAYAVMLVRQGLAAIAPPVEAVGPATDGTSSSQDRDSLRSPAGMVPARSGAP
ncbi:MAG: MarC family protein [Candidatus Omnitrophica bacterium]|nr:MarC family protein [Candidatus Omnitrophota bacterium]